MDEEKTPITPYLSLNNMADGKEQNTSDDKMLVDTTHRVDPKLAYKYRNWTLIVSWVSVVYLSVMGIAVLVLAIVDSSSASFAFALDALLDCASSMVVIWRYSGSAASVYSASKEKAACVALGGLFIASFFTIMVRSAVSLSTHAHSKPTFTLWVLSAVNAALCALLLVAKALLARWLESISIATDAVNSGMGMLVALSVVLGDFIYIKYHIWYLDSVIGIITSIFFLGYGIWLIVYELFLVNKGKASSNNNES